jgi:carnitine O-acetyltransferase
MVEADNATMGTPADKPDELPQPQSSFEKEAVELEPSITVRDFGKETSAISMESALSNTSVTFGAQPELPRLPIPSLDETMNKFLKHLQALQEEEEREEAQEVVLEFMKEDGPKLQKILLEYDCEGTKSGELGSYVEHFWNESYLAPDSSVVLNLNPFFVLEDGPDPKIAKDPIRRAASLCFASVKMASMLKSEKVKPDTFRGKPLCMDQFKALFSTARVPSRHSKDSINVYEESNHVAVMCKSQIYYFQVLWPDGDVAVDEGDLIDILTAIQRNASGIGPVESARSALGVLTSLSRSEWALAREEMIHASSKNEESLQIVDSALFVLVLDDYIPKTEHDMAANMLHGSYELKTGDTYSDCQVGSCCNRWYDKLQIIVCGDGTAGINFEHSAIDGHTALRFVSDVYAETVISFAQSITKLVAAHDVIPNVIIATVKRAALTLDNEGRTTLDVFPKRVAFELPKNVLKRIFYAETALGDQICSSDTRVVEFKEYGKLFIVGNKLSPDSFIQMSMMLAYYKLYGRIVCAYEPVMTKSFFHGRTEAMRPATVEAKQLCEVFCCASATPTEKLAALTNASRVHSSFVKDCLQGKGVDRHLFALKCIAERANMPLPPFFQSAPWKLLNHTILSTSNCGNPALRLFGFGPAVADGLGIVSLPSATIDATITVFFVFLLVYCSLAFHSANYFLSRATLSKTGPSIIPFRANTAKHSVMRLRSKAYSGKWLQF